MCLPQAPTVDSHVGEDRRTINKAGQIHHNAVLHSPATRLPGKIIIMSDWRLASSTSLSGTNDLMCWPPSYLSDSREIKSDCMMEGVHEVVLICSGGKDGRMLLRQA